MPDSPDTMHIIADELFPGDGTTVNDTLVSVAAGRIVDLRALQSMSDLPDDAIHAEVCAPGFIDLQINGAMDIQFTDTPTPEAVNAIVKGARRGGTAHVLPTFTTAPGTRYLEAFRAVKLARQQGLRGILGLHLEGPFLSPDRPGIHAKEFIRPIEESDLNNLIDFSEGELLLTVAPECQAEGFLKRLSDAGVVVFAGHSQSAKKDIDRAIGEGLCGATHLFNAMSQMTGREPGLVGGVLASSSLFAGIVADGHHVDFANISVAAAMMKGRLFLVTDAMRSLEGNETSFAVQGKKVTLKAGKLTDQAGTLAGAHISLDACVRNVIEHCGIHKADAIGMVSAVPATVLGLEHELGFVRKGYRASFTLMSRDLKARQVVTDGCLVWSSCAEDRSD